MYIVWYLHRKHVKSTNDVQKIDELISKLLNHEFIIPFCANLMLFVYIKTAMSLILNFNCILNYYLDKSDLIELEYRTL